MEVFGVREVLPATTQREEGECSRRIPALAWPCVAEPFMPNSHGVEHACGRERKRGRVRQVKKRGGRGEGTGEAAGAAR